MFISIAGNIGLGKSTLAKIISEEWDFKLKEERVGEANEYLIPFYEDINAGVKPSKRAHDLQMFFLETRAKDHRELQESEGRWVQDRSIYEDPYIFAIPLNNEGFLSDLDYDNYLDSFHKAEEDLKFPSLLVHLRGTANLARERISKRNRPEEAKLIDPANDYLDRLNNLYETFLSRYGGDCLIINANHDIENNPDERKKVLKLIKGHTPGLNIDKARINPPNI